MRDTPRTFGVLGDPINHSLSPIIHNAAFRAQKLNCVYLLLHLKTRDVKRALLAMQLTDIEGCNVTTPHKQTIMPYLDALDATAVKAGAVNTIYQRKRQWIGANTDGAGFVMACKQRRVSLRGKSVTILGAGGVASAIIAALTTQGVRRIILLNRSPKRAIILKRKFDHASIEILTAPLNAASYRQYLPEADILVHATSSGMGQNPTLAIPLHLLPRKAAVCDCQYQRSTHTPLIAQALRLQHRIVDGFELLLCQAAESYRLWTGRRAPIITMRRAGLKHTRLR